MLARTGRSAGLEVVAKVYPAMHRFTTICFARLNSAVEARTGSSKKSRLASSRPAREFSFLMTHQQEEDLLISAYGYEQLGL